MSPTTSPAAPATILFVDDEIRVVNLLRISFRDKYKVLIATSGRDALEIMRTTPVDVSGLSSGVMSITVGFNHTCAILNDGTV